MFLALTFQQDLILILAMIFIGIFSQMMVTKSYNQYLKYPNSTGMSGAEAATKFLEANGIYDVQVVATKGFLNDYYDPSRKVIKLSESNYYGKSISSVSVACHEVGHAIQHAKGYKMLVLRNKLVPLVSFSSSVSWLLIFLGILLGSLGFVYVGIALFGTIALFQLVTLPVEFNASSRALKFFRSGNVMSMDETYASKKVLNAAAFTYVAALLTSMIQLARLLLIFGNNDR
ncbi:MAG: zinc metallopeptidase [Bacilli bacterium]|nr:zinc metallopeptidase [Bacilli bacterium]